MTTHEAQVRAILDRGLAHLAEKYPDLARLELLEDMLSIFEQIGERRVSVGSTDPRVYADCLAALHAEIADGRREG